MVEPGTGSTGVGTTLRTLSLLAPAGDIFYKLTIFIDWKEGSFSP